MIPVGGAEGAAPEEAAAVTTEELVVAIREKARALYEGTTVQHRSCGMAIAEAFGRATHPYHALRRGGVTGVGQCGAIVAGQLVLGELFGYPDPTAPTSFTLRDALTRYHAEITAAFETVGSAPWVCNELVARFPDFHAAERLGFCTDAVVAVAEIVARIALDLGATLEATPIVDP